MHPELTGTRRRILRGAWWIVLVCGLWLTLIWPMDAYRVVPLCNPAEHHDTNAGNPATFVMGLIAVIAARRALRRGVVSSSNLAAAVLFLASPIAFIEWMVVTMQITHRCGARVTESWIAAPTRDAALVVALCGPVLLVLVPVLTWLERRRGAYLPPARVAEPRIAEPRVTDTCK